MEETQNGVLSQTLDEARLIQKILEGDTDAFQQIVDMHGRNLLSAYRQLARFDGRSSLATWLYRITSNRAIDVLRSRGRRKEVDPAEAPQEYAETREPDPERITYSGQMKQHINKALESLGPKERAAFVLRHYEGLSTAEIGEALGLGLSAAKHAVFRAVRKLKLILAPSGGMGS